MTNEISPNLPRILVVDDSRIVRAGVKKHLSTNFEIIEEADGEAGWARLSSDPEILVLMSDLSMPKLDGFGLLQRVRRSQDPRIRQTPIIIISGEEEPETRNRAVDMGANDFVTKSTDRAEMLARVSAAAKVAQAARDARRHIDEQVQDVPPTPPLPQVAQQVQPEPSAPPVQQATTTDPQTGVASGHLLSIEGEKVLAHAMRYQGDATLVLFELDNFDSLMHEMGDKVADQLMGLVAKLVSGRLRKEETLARLDGPRFAVVLYADVEGSLTYAERLRETIAAARVNFKRRQIKVTASVGIANARADETNSFDELMRVAVNRLTEARNEGGNRLASPVPKPLISIEQALALLANGDEAAVVPHLVGLMGVLRPLLDLAARRAH